MEKTGDNFDDYGEGEVAFWLSSRGMGKEKGRMGATSDGDRGGGHTVVVSFSRLDLAVKHPPPFPLGHASVGGRFTQQSTQFVNGCTKKTIKSKTHGFNFII
jgi:hypothetical protein